VARGRFSRDGARRHRVRTPSRSRSLKRIAGALVAIGNELAGLFVEDRYFALAIAVWIAAVAAVLRFASVERGIASVMFFAGLATILLTSVLRATRGEPR
jgi:hypothetical protein